MGLKKAENQVRVMLADTIVAMCRNTLNYHGEVCVEGLLGITLDKEEIFLVSINQTITNPEVLRQRAENEANDAHGRKRRSEEDESDSESSGSEAQSEAQSEQSKSKKSRRKRRKRKTSTQSSTSASDSESEKKSSKDHDTSGEIPEIHRLDDSDKSDNETNNDDNSTTNDPINHAPIIPIFPTGHAFPGVFPGHPFVPTTPLQVPHQVPGLGGQSSAVSIKSEKSDDDIKSEHADSNSSAAQQYSDFVAGAAAQFPAFNQLHLSNLAAGENSNPFHNASLQLMASQQQVAAEGGVPQPGPSNPETEQAVAYEISPREEEARIPWPVRYELPSFPPQVARSLEAQDEEFKRPTKSPVRAALMRALYDDITRYTLYPSRYQYHDVCSALIMKYPFLRDQSETGYRTLKDCLINKMKKERRPKISDETVLLMKRKHAPGGRPQNQPEEGDERITKVKRKYAPSNETVDDEFSMDIQHVALIEELQQADPDHSKIKECMLRTSPKRKLDYEELDSAQLLEKYPFLMQPNLILYEMELLFGHNLLLNVRENAERIFESISEMEQGVDLEAFIDSQPETCRRRLRMNASLLKLPALLKEDDERLFLLNQNPNFPSPQLVIRGQSALDSSSAELWIDGQKMMDLNMKDDGVDILLLLSCLMSVYWLFNIQYPKCLRHTLSYLESFVFNLDNRPTMKATKLHTCLIRN